MSDQKSKIPDLKEIGDMASKLFQAVQKSVSEIIQDYKSKRVETAPSVKTSEEVEVPIKKPVVEAAPKKTTVPKEEPPITINVPNETETKAKK